MRLALSTVEFPLTGANMKADLEFKVVILLIFT